MLLVSFWTCFWLGAACHLPVEVVEEGDEVEAELDKALLLVARERAEDLCRVVHVVLLHDPGLSA